VCWVGKTPQLEPTHRGDLFILGLSFIPGREGWSEGVMLRLMNMWGDSRVQKKLPAEALGSTLKSLSEGRKAENKLQIVS